jgi:4a-hydroxytetrahydrobiopterin dehydratase
MADTWPTEIEWSKQTKHHFTRTETMKVQNAEKLSARKCVPCEGGIDPCPLPFVREQLEKLPGWYLTHENQRIRKDWQVKNFMAGIKFFQTVADVAEAEEHHPDLHLVGYRNVSVELWTHAIGGLSENDFILAAKLDQIPIETK